MENLEERLPSWHVKYDDFSSFGFSIAKKGDDLGDIKLSNNNITVLGREKDSVHIELEHPSISRRHAAIFFGSENSVHIIDFGSSHGTYINDVKMIGGESKPLEIDSKVRFGDSARIYTFKSFKNSYEEKSINDKLPKSLVEDNISKEEQRKAWQEEIAKFANEMKNTVPKLKAKSKSIFETFEVDTDAVIVNSDEILNNDDNNNQNQIENTNKENSLLSLKSFQRELNIDENDNLG